MSSSQSPQDPDTPTQDPASGQWRLPMLLLVAVLLGITAGGVAVYLNNAGPDNQQTASSCPVSQTALDTLDGVAHGEMAAFAVSDDPRPAPDMSFMDAQGTLRSMADWQGKTVLFNLWATWCAPCREEMPALDNLQAELGGDDFEVVAVNIDTREGADPQGFLEEINIASLAFYQDSTATLFRDMRAEGLAFGMPTTLLISDEGCLLGMLAGAAHWDSRDALTLMRTAQAL